MEYDIRIIHMIPALVCVFLGAYIFLSKKGDQLHKFNGRVWAFLMLFVAVTGLFITGGPFEIYAGYGYIHLFSVLTIISVSFAVWAVKKKRYKLHAVSMIATFIGLVFAGIFAVISSGRLLNNVLMGGG